MMRALWLGLLLHAAPTVKKAADAPVAKPLAPPPPSSAAMVDAHGGTACGSCHVTENWKKVKFDHAKTGFPLKGLHASVACRGCHLGTFQAAIPMGCAGCHADPHAGELGMQCQGCHDEKSWASRFGVDAHRTTAFPLVGAHAALPCEECHERTATRRFARGAAECNACHAADYQRTSASAVDHLKLGFSTECQQCHMAWSFRPARFPDHDKCFVLSSGSHAAIACETCHTSIPTVATLGTCNTGTAACTSCHSHECPKSDSQHVPKGVLGYQCKDRRCAECHKERVP